MNELEMLLMCCKKALQDKSGGVKFKNGNRMAYKQAEELILGLDTHFRLEGAMSFGICKDCIHFNQSGYQSLGNIGGRCEVRKADVTGYGTCDRHS